MIRIEGLPHSADVVDLSKKSSIPERFNISPPPHDILVLRVYVKRGTVTKDVLEALTGKDKPSEHRTVIIGVVDREKTKTSLGKRVLNMFIEEERDDVAASESTEG